MQSTLRGRITVAETGQAAAGLLVTALDAHDQRTLARAVSRVDGTFEMHLAPRPRERPAQDDDRGREILLEVTTRDRAAVLYRSERVFHWPPGESRPIEITVPSDPLSRATVSFPFRFSTGDEAIDRTGQRHLASMHRATGTREFLAIADADTDVELDRIEKLIAQRHFGQALDDLDRVEPGDSPLRPYHLLRRETLRARSCSRIATVYALEGKIDRARYFYRKALQPPAAADANDLAEQGRAAAVVDQGFAARVKERRRLIDALVAAAVRPPSASGCDDRRGLMLSSFFDDLVLQQVDLSTMLQPERWRRQADGGGRPPLPGPRRGWLDTVDSSPEEWGISFAAEARPRPGAVVQYAGSDAPALDIGVRNAEQKVAGAYFMPLAHARLQALTGLLALEKGVDLAGDKRQVAPLYRYSHLRERVLGMLERLDRIERKMIDLQLALDDFAQIKAEINDVLGDKRAELAALNERIDGMTNDLGLVTTLEHDVNQAHKEIEHYQEECDTEWWEIVLGIVLVVGAAIVGIVIGGYLGGAAGAAAGGFLTTILALSVVERLGIWAEAPVDCENVDEAEQAFREALKEIRRGRRALEDELEVALAQRDVLEAEVGALEYRLQVAIEANAARHLNAKTMAAILSTYEETRQHLLGQATALGRKLEASYRFEYGDHWRRPGQSSGDLIARSYEARDGKGYGGREQLLKDVESLEFMRLTGRTSKAMLLTQVVSLRRHYPATLAAFRLGTRAAFTLTQQRFDDWFPGTYLHRIRDVHVEVHLDGKPAPVRGYIGSLGASSVRFRDPANEFPVDGSAILREVDAGVRHLCFKRAAQLGVHDIAAFPEMRTVRADARAADEQRVERNAFEGLGLGATFTLELLPDQPIDLESITDVLVHFQVEAEFDAQLKRVLETKRFDRTHVAELSTRRMSEHQGREFSPQQIEFDLAATALPYPYRGKEIRDLALLVVPRAGAALDGPVAFAVQLRDEPRVPVQTDDAGRAASGKSRHAGPDGDTIRTAFAGKDPTGRWRLSIEGVPQGFAVGDVDDVLMFVRYGFAAA